jgi:hypothetical protein
VNGSRKACQQSEIQKALISADVGNVRFPYPVGRGQRHLLGRIIKPERRLDNIERCLMDIANCIATVIPKPAGSFLIFYARRMV